MSFTTTVVKILIASPSDVSAERDALSDVISTWNIWHSRDYGIMLSPVRWETHASPELGDRPQAIINRQLVDECDALIGIFRARLGTPTGAAESGTVEEIERFRAQGKQVLLYFSDAPLDEKKLDPVQYDALQIYMDKLRSDGLLETYQNIPELREKATRHITEVARRFRGNVALKTMLDTILGLVSTIEIEDSVLTRLVGNLKLSEVLVLRDLFFIAGRRSVPVNPNRALKLGDQCSLLFGLSDKAVKAEVGIAKNPLLLFELASQPYVDQLWPELKPELELQNYFGPNLVNTRIIHPAEQAIEAG